MMRSSYSVLWLALVLIAVSGCKKKQKPVATAVPAPTITAPVTTTPVPVTKPAASVPDKPPVSEPPKTKPKAKLKPVAKKPVVKPPVTEPNKAATAPTTHAKATPPRIVVQPPATSPGEQSGSVVPGMSHTEDAHHRQTTEQLLLSTEANLKSLQRVLNPDERSLLQQIQLFMTLSREASQSQDLVRAHNLALKAHLLSDELVR